MKQEFFDKALTIRWPGLVLGMVLTLLLSLSVHLGMLQGLGIPFPEFAGVSAWASFTNTTLSILALMFVSASAQPTLVRFSPMTRCIVLFLLYATLRESLRGIVMNGVVTTGWGFDVVAGLPGLASALVLSILVVSVTHKLKRPGVWLNVFVAAAIAALLIFAVRPVVSRAFEPVMEAALHLNHTEVYAFPYGWHVLVPAYLSYAEPVCACMVLAALTWRYLSIRPGVRLLQFALLVLSIRGMLLPTFVYSFYSKVQFGLAMLSQSQFLLETLVLGILTGLTWQFSTFREPDSAMVNLQRRTKQC